MNFKIIWSDFAIKQMDEILNFYLNRTKSERIANQIIKRILKASERLKTNPEIGQLESALEGRSVEYRYVLESNYKLIYTINSDTFSIRITDVFDTRQSPFKIKRNK